MTRSKVSNLIGQSRPFAALVLFAAVGAVMHLAASLSTGEHKVAWSIDKQKQQIEELEKMRIEGINKRAAAEIDGIREWKAQQRRRELESRPQMQVIPEQTDPRMEDLPE